MKIRAYRATMTEFPPAGVRWKWGDVVGDGDDQVDPRAACAAKPLLEKHADGTYEVSRRLAEYLDEKWGIECSGSPVAPEQATLPTGADPTGPAGRPGDDDDGPSTRVLAHVDGWQVTLDNRRADPAELRARCASGKRTTAERVESMRRSVGDCQATLGAFTECVRVGGFRRPSGSVYSGPSATVA